jgi:hypothetical protein
MIFSCVVPFKRRKKKIPDLSLPPCTLRTPILASLVDKYCTKIFYMTQRPVTCMNIKGDHTQNNASIILLQH